MDDDARSTFGEIKQQARAIVERSAEERMVADAVQTSAAGGLAALGLQPRLWAGSVAAVGCADTALKKYVVAASLRFPLPPEPEQ